MRDLFNERGVLCNVHEVCLDERVYNRYEQEADSFSCSVVFGSCNPAGALVPDAQVHFLYFVPCWSMLAVHPGPSTGSGKQSMSLY